MKNPASPHDAETTHGPALLKLRLSVMMFMQYGIWGAWLPLLYPFLSEHRGFTPSQIGDMFAVGAIGAIVAPFIAGQIADRYFSTERYLAFSHLIGAVLVWLLARATSYNEFLALSLAYSLVYSPTLPLTNALAFHHLPDRNRDFGKVRVWGTVGWIAVGIGIGQWLLRQHTPAGLTPDQVHAAQVAGMGDAFRLSGILGVLMGLYAFTLPHTPPARDVRSNAAFKAITAVKRQPLLTVFLLAVPISCVHQFYFVHTAGFLGKFQTDMATRINDVFGVGGGGLMTVGQMVEILVLAAMPVLARSLSRKTLLGIGLVAYAARMALFAFVGPISASTGVPEVAVLVTGVGLHGLCFGCFIFVSFMIVDEETSGDIRASAQSLYNLVIIGFGTIVGSKVAGWVAEWASGGGAMDYTRLFSVPMWASMVCLLLLLTVYPSRGRAAAASP